MTLPKSWGEGSSGRTAAPAPAPQPQKKKKKDPFGSKKKVFFYSFKIDFFLFNSIFTIK